MKRIVLLLVATILCGAAATSAHAEELQGYYQPPPPRGYRYSVNPMYAVRGYIGFSGVGTAVLAQSGGAEYLNRGGGGLSLWGGIRFGPVFALELNYTGSFHNPVSGCDVGVYYTICSANYLVIDMLSVDAKIHIPTRTNFDPFLQGGLMLSWIGREGFASDATGGGFDLGGGFDIWLNPWWTFGLRGLYRGMRMSDYATYTGTDTFISLFTGEVNIAVHF
ncbi:MAG TPA: hypothetical protein VKN99_27570 [Polyangia bacterium]|nr:hypothetical protein [Polyangia bacterium]